MITRYEDLVRAIGPGFHPDASGHDYTSLPEGVTPELVDKIVEQAFFEWDRVDPYVRAMNALVE